MNITEFLLARISEDEALALQAGNTAWQTDCRHAALGLEHRDGGYDRCCAIDADDDSMHIYDEGGHSRSHALHIVRWHPPRVLAQCEANRRILTEHEQLDLRSMYGIKEPCCAICVDLGSDWDYVEGPCITVRALAAPYNWHPDYQPEWAL